MSRARKIPDRRQPLRPQRVERVSVMPQDMKSKDVAIPNQEVRIKRKPQQTGVGVAIPNQKRARVERRPQRPQQVAEAKAFPEERGRPVTRIGNRTIYEADVREAKANQQNLLQAQLKNLLPKKATAVQQKLPPEVVEKLKKQQREFFRKRRQDQLRQQRQQQQAVDPRTGKPLTPQQLKQIREQTKEFERKNRIAERYIKGEIGRRDLKETFTRQEIRNIEKGSVYRKYMDGKITDRQLSRSRMFSPQEIRSIKTQLRIKRMSPEERRAYTERQRKERQRLDKMAEDRRTQPQRRRRQIRDAFRRMREERRRRRGRTNLEKPTRGTAPVRYRTRRQQERATGVRVPRRGRRGLFGI